MAKISELLASLEMDELMEAVQKELDNGTDPVAILKEGEAGMVKVGDLKRCRPYLTLPAFQAAISLS